MIYQVDRHKWPEGSPARRLAELMHEMAYTDDPEMVAEFEIAVQEAGQQLSAHLEDLLDLRTNMLASCDEIADEIVRLKNLQVEREARAQRLHDAVIHYMNMVGSSEVMTTRNTLRLRKNPPKVEIYDEAGIPTEYMREVTKVEIKADKKAIAEALKMGIEVNGCALIQTTRLDIK